MQKCTTCTLMQKNFDSIILEKDSLASLINREKQYNYYVKMLKNAL